MWGQKNEALRFQRIKLTFQVKIVLEVEKAFKLVFTLHLNSVLQAVWSRVLKVIFRDLRCRGKMMFC